jgi:Spy/CpxP family protein refolding chaperone
MSRERMNLAPLMAQLRATRERLMPESPGASLKEKEAGSVTSNEAAALAKLIVANSRMQAKIYGILTPEQRKKLDDAKRAGGLSF